MLVSALEGPPAAHADSLARALLAAHAAALVEFRTRDPALVTEAGPCPIASPLARLQAREGTVVTNLLGTGVKLEGSLARELLLRLDGSRDRTALVRDLGALVTSGAVTLSEAGAPIRDPDRATERLGAGLNEKLRQLGIMALLIG